MRLTRGRRGVIQYAAGPGGAGGAGFKGGDGGNGGLIALSDKAHEYAVENGLERKYIRELSIFGLVIRLQV
jgi:hypothetical protein